MKQTLASFTLTPATPWGSAPKVRLYANSQFRASTGELHPAGSESENYTVISLSASGDGFTFPTSIFDTTDDSSDPNATYSAVVVNGNKVVYTLFDRWMFRASLGATISWDDLETSNVTRVPLRDDTAYSKVQMDLRIASQLAVSNPATISALGRVKMDTAPADPTSPVAVGANSPRLYSHGVNVAALATGGSGTAADPYTGWDTAIGAFQSDTAYFFSDDVFSYSTPIVITDKSRCHLVGRGARATTLKFTGAGIALTVKGTVVGSFFSTVQHLEIDGNALCTKGLYTEAAHAMVVRDVNVRNCTLQAFHVKFGILNTYDNIRCSQVADLASGFTVVPLNGFYTEARGGGETFQGCTLINPKFEVLLGDGMEFNDAWQVEVYGGSSEQNVGRGVLVNGTCRNVTFHGMDCEVNGGDDWTILGDFCQLLGVLSSGTIRVKSGAQMTRVVGGQCNSLVTEASTSGHIESFTYNIGGTGTLSFGDPYGWNIIAPLHNLGAGATGSGTTLASLGALMLGFPLGTNEPAWDVTNQAVINLGGAGAMHSEKATTSPALQFTNNAYFDSLGAWRYRVTGLPASNVYQLGGAFVFRTAPSGTAGNAITWTTVQTIAATGAVTYDSGTATATAGAATLSKQSGTITSEALTTAAGSDYVLTLTNTLISATSKVLATVDNGTNTTEGIAVHRVTPGSGSVVIRIRNTHAASALNGTIRINFVIF